MCCKKNAVSVQKFTNGQKLATLSKLTHVCATFLDNFFLFFFKAKICSRPLQFFFHASANFGRSAFCWMLLVKSGSERCHRLRIFKNHWLYPKANSSIINFIRVISRSTINLVCKINILVFKICSFLSAGCKGSTSWLCKPFRAVFSLPKIGADFSSSHVV